MTLETHPYDSARYLDSEEAIAAYLDEAFQSGDAAVIANAASVADRAKIMHNIARGAGDRRAYRIENLPDDLAALLEAGLDELANGVPEEGDNIIG
jgi:probable addiction module antidote protein